MVLGYLYMGSSHIKRKKATGAGRIALASAFCYYWFTHGSRLPTPLLLLLVDDFRRVYALVSDFLPAIHQKTHPSLKSRCADPQYWPSAIQLLKEVMHAGR
jgi:hypothetical protein